MPTLLNVGQRRAYERDGYIIIPSLFDTEEIRTAEAAKRLETVYIKRKAGDNLFFHCNTLHCSDQNRSPNRRWTLICCYNAARNGPYLDHHHPHYTKLEKVSDDAVHLGEAKHANASEFSAFMDKSHTPPEIKKLEFN
jgi:hypothetical protein